MDNTSSHNRDKPDEKRDGSKTESFKILVALLGGARKLEAEVPCETKVSQLKESLIKYLSLEDANWDLRALSKNGGYEASLDDNQTLSILSIQFDIAHLYLCPIMEAG